MDAQRARDIVSALADGVNPLTGEVLDDDCVCNQADVVRALHAAVAVMNKDLKRKSRPTPENMGKPWTAEEDAKITSEYQQGVPGNEIAKAHQRTKGGIAARLVRLGIIPDRSAMK